MMIRENNVRPNNDSEKCRSVLWSFGNLTIRVRDDSVILHLVMFFFSVRQRFGEMTFWENDVAPRCCYHILFPLE